MLFRSSSNSAIGSRAGARQIPKSSKVLGGASSTGSNRASTLTENSSKILQRFRVVLLPTLYPAADFHSHSLLLPDLGKSVCARFCLHGPVHHRHRLRARAAREAQRCLGFARRNVAGTRSMAPRPQTPTRYRGFGPRQRPQTAAPAKLLEQTRPHAQLID